MDPQEVSLFTFSSIKMQSYLFCTEQGSGDLEGLLFGRTSFYRDELCSEDIMNNCLVSR